MCQSVCDEEKSRYNTFKLKSLIISINFSNKYTFFTYLLLINMVILIEDSFFFYFTFIQRRIIDNKRYVMLKNHPFLYLFHICSLILVNYALIKSETGAYYYDVLLHHGVYYEFKYNNMPCLKFNFINFRSSKRPFP